MPWTDLVTDEQQEAIESNLQNRAVIAGPGTGKTRTLLAKAIQLIEDELVTAGNLRIVNFTNAGVRDLKRKLHEFEQFSVIEASTITTFHSLALGALRRVRSTSVPSPLAIVDDWEEAMFIDRFAKARLGINDIRKAKRMRDDYNSRWCIAREDVDEWLNERDRRRFEAVYNAAKDILGFTTRGELTFLWWRHMRSVRDVTPAELGFTGSSLLVDEYQDLNECEGDILQLLATAGVPVFAVGDPNQSIYEGLRHAHPELCWTFEQRLNPADLKILATSHRCPRAILILGRALLGTAQGVPDPDRASVEGEAHILFFPSDSAERSAMARLAEFLLRSDPAARIMVLIPTRRFAATLVLEFEAVGVEVDDRTNREEGGSLGCRLARALVRLLIEPRNSVAAATAIVLRCARTTRSQSAVELLSLAEERGEKVAALLWSDAHIQGRLGKAIDTVRKDVERLRAAGDDIGSVLEEITGCGEQAADPNRIEERLDELLDDPAALDEGKVTIMTLHSAKGLEADWVIIPAVEPGSFERDEVGARKEERRRLLYVGMTRAKRGAFLTYARTRFGNLRYADPTSRSPQKGASVFIHEICDRLSVRPENGTQFLHQLLRAGN